MTRFFIDSNLTLNRKFTYGVAAVTIDNRISGRSVKAVISYTGTVAYISGEKVVIVRLPGDQILK